MSARILLTRTPLSFLISAFSSGVYGCVGTNLIPRASQNSTSVRLSNSPPPSLENVLIQCPCASNSVISLIVLTLPSLFFFSGKHHLYREPSSCINWKYRNPVSPGKYLPISPVSDLRRS
ncbi:hypothetical protein PF001_g11832 [Phytophthora fragariae]|uniref:RxLR effector protein n=1 Tax=Phytophthora fragariae TaxID=53985 RepID=A0A6A4DEJ9_9STRA|nr:hypothetical protein PF003_g18400 [Phytophthora fragariae]KAE8944609.1 hypothetical protein PF009_g5720 [Phytophthora fragariae]KAE9006775.1 hypothetical protein PF011_g11421 [Phytophthora fragariae]KAE9142444.1 hypothetical protein PF006_g12441 [Phytophthora fragariae]KAE9307005.1 hypothetical protein PF001_g11832 [Phytophthora fragariae]